MLLSCFIFVNFEDTLYDRRVCRRDRRACWLHAQLSPRCGLLVGSCWAGLFTRVLDVARVLPGSARVASCCVTYPDTSRVAFG
jgi:hypothetical protein